MSLTEFGLLRGRVYLAVLYGLLETDALRQLAAAGPQRQKTVLLELCRPWDKGPHWFARELCMQLCAQTPDYAQAVRDAFRQGVVSFDTDDDVLFSRLVAILLAEPVVVIVSGADRFPPRDGAVLLRFLQRHASADLRIAVVLPESSPLGPNATFTGSCFFRLGERLCPGCDARFAALSLGLTAQDVPLAAALALAEEGPFYVKKHRQALVTQLLAAAQAKMQCNTPLAEHCAKTARRRSTTKAQRSACDETLAAVFAEEGRLWLAQKTLLSALKNAGGDPPRQAVLFASLEALCQKTSSPGSSEFLRRGKELLSPAAPPKT